MPDLRTVADRDGWRCWLCDEPVPRAASAGDPDAATVDHVVPRSRGGRGGPANLRLAHRRCNARRGSRPPQLSWPRRFALVDAPDLWQCLQRLQRPGGGGQVVALLARPDDAAAAAAWVERRARSLFPGRWRATTDRLGPLTAVRLARQG